jgi:hypothetical protein
MSGALLVTANSEAVEPAVRISLKRLAGEAGMTPRTFLKHARIAESKGWLKVVRFSPDEYGFTPMIPEGFEHGAN